jgi:hypothetical protein
VSNLNQQKNRNSICSKQEAGIAIDKKKPHLSKHRVDPTASRKHNAPPRILPISDVLQFKRTPPIQRLMTFNKPIRAQPRGTKD